MSYLSVGDMAQTYQLRRHSAQLKQTAATLSEEMTTGIQKDLGKAVKGDYRALSAIDTSLSRLEAYTQNSKMATLYSSSMQSSLASVQEMASSVASSLISASSGVATSSREVAVQQAAQSFEAVIDTLNTKVSGRYIFSGTDVASRPVAPADTILAALGSAVNGLTTSSDILAAIDNWFAAPAGSGGFADIAYTGGTNSVTETIISDTDKVSLPTTAADLELRDTLKGFAISALVAGNFIPADETVINSLVRASGEQLLSADTALSTLRGQVGVTEEKIASAQAANTSEKTSLNLARLSLIGIDEYETATALEAVTSQIETLYTLTSRLSSLSLTDYL